MDNIVNKDYQFDGDIIITDPCYLFKGYENWLNPRIYGICSSTICGDWTAGVFNADTNEKIGDFCADAGMVCVCYVDDNVMKTLAEKTLVEKKLGEWCFTIIRDFHGKVRIQHKDGECRVIGKGSVNFIGLKTGF